MLTTNLVFLATSLADLVPVCTILDMFFSLLTIVEWADTKWTVVILSRTRVKMVQDFLISTTFIAFITVNMSLIQEFHAILVASSCGIGSLAHRALLATIELIIALAADESLTGLTFLRSIKWIGTDDAAEILVFNCHIRDSVGNVVFLELIHFGAGLAH